jgi:predicted nucleic-acid-binding Zn-ribbon protein
MKTTLTCPKCSAGKIWRIDRFTTPGEYQGGSEMRMVIDRGLERPLTAGRFDAYVCHDCGYTEFYARDRAELRHEPLAGVHLLERAGTAPYR